MSRRRTLSFASALAIVTLAGSALPSCADDFSTERPRSAAGTTLGEDIYSGLCERVGATTLPEDLTGVSYRGICYRSSAGWADKVDEAKLPSLLETDERGRRARRLSLAKLEAMARRRGDLIGAFDALFPDVELDDPFAAGKKVRLYDALDLLTKRMTPLYDGDPYAPGGQPVMPASTRSLGRLLGALSENKAAAEALARIGERLGYRPAAQALGVMRPLLTSPHLRRSVKELVRLVSAGGPAEKPFQAFLAAAEQEMRTMQADAPTRPLAVDDGRLQPSRPRLTGELLTAAGLLQGEAFRVGDAPRFLARRDRRGFALPAGAHPEGLGPVPSPFADVDADGFADVDAFGRFVGPDGAPLGAPPPFRVFLASADGDFAYDDATSRPLAGDRLIFSYLDVSQTFTASVLRDTRPLFAPRSGGAEGGASTVFKALRGARPIFGDRRETTKAFADRGGRDLTYDGFDPASSPLPDLAHAAGQLLAAPESDDYLGFLLDLHEKRPELTARALGAAQSLLDESKSPKYDAARLDPASPLFDDLGAWLAKASRVGPDLYTGGQPGANPKGLLYDVFAALAAPGVAELVRQNFAPTFANKDRISYDPNDLNGPPVNLDTGEPFVDALAFKTPVDRSRPAEGDNESAFKRFVDVVYYADHVRTCNKPGTVVKSKACGISLDFPFAGTIGECELYQIDELAVFFLDSFLDYNHPRRAVFPVQGDLLKALVDALGLIPGCLPDGFETNLDAALAAASGIEGLSLKPTPQALSRLVFFGGPSDRFPGAPDLDPLLGGKNAEVASFISSMTDAIGSIECPPNARGVNTCASFDQTLRGIIPNTLFMTEYKWQPRKPDGCAGFDCDLPTSGFVEGMRPLVTAFANYRFRPADADRCVRDQFGTCPAENLLTELMDILFKHWPSGGSGLWRYEELADWVMNQSDLFGTAAELLPALRDQAYVSPRAKAGQPRPGLEVVAAMMPVLFDPEVAKQLGVTDRQGATTATTNDGRPKDLAVFDLFLDALERSDARFAALGAEGEARRAAWREARSELTDQFLLARDGSWQNVAVQQALGPLGRLMREQLNARCPDRETGGGCDWAKAELSADVADALGGPLFSALADLGDALAADPAARGALETLVGYLLEQAQDADVLAEMMVSAADVLQLLQDEPTLVPIVNTMSVAAAPSSGRETPGMADTSLKLLRALLDDRDDLPPEKAREAMIDRYHVVDAVLKNAVAPMARGGRSPFEVLADVASDVHRIDAAADSPLDADDYRAMGESIRGFLTDPYRGLEQFYNIVRTRNGN